ncbi:MAG: SAM-dependent chlorinase/fluorinase [Chloroflexi bacterium]|nr:MAG: SAM-dependent chlorinase/fluorinase [Chloroflexota bacterium]
MKPSGIVTLLTDFGLDDAYVGAMKGAILSVYAKAAVVDITHGVRPFAVLQGAFLLDSAWRSFPPGTVHVAVVDPGVGTDRRAIAFNAADHYFVGPDNGLFTFLTAGAALAGVGRPHRAEPLRLPDAWASKVGEAWRAEALHCDHWGNVISNLPIRALARIKQANGMRVRTVETYEDAQPNELVALVGSSGRIEFALREGSAATRLHVAPGETLLVT